MSTVERLASMRDALHRQFRELGYTTNSQTSELLDLVFAAFTPADGGGQGVTPLTEAARDVLAERQRQISVEGWTPEHDDEHGSAEMAQAAACYALNAAGHRFTWPLDTLWPWSRGWWKPNDPRRDLVKAGALILAEIERLDRRYGTPASTGGEHAE